MERQTQQTKKPSNRSPKPAGSSTPAKKRIAKVVKPKKKTPVDALSKTRKNKTRKQQNLKPPDSETEDPVTSYKKRFENFQQYMEDKLEEIMSSDKIQKPDAQRIMKKFHSAMVEERNSMQRIIEDYRNDAKYDFGENNDEGRKIENEFKKLDDLIKQSHGLDEQEEQTKPENSEKSYEEKDNTAKENVNQRATRSRTMKSNRPRTTRSVRKNLTTQTDSTRKACLSKSGGKANDKNEDGSNSKKKKELVTKIQNLRKEISLGNKSNLSKSDKLMQFLRTPSSDESSDNDILLNSSVEKKKKIGTNKVTESTKRRGTQPEFQNKKSVEEKERQDVLMTLLGEENVRRASMRGNRQARKKAPVFR